MPRADPATLRKAACLAALVLLVGSALLFPLTGAAGVALVVLVALAGGLAGSPWVKERAARVRARAVTQARWAPDAFVVLAVVAASAVVFGDTWFQTGLRAYDWGPHHANLKNLIDALRRGGVPRWVQGVSTGDSPYELYPLLPYWLMARAALLFGTTDLTLVLVRTAVLTHTLAALGGGLLARRVVGTAWGVVVGLVMLFDQGSVWGGGAEGIFKLGVLHAALANAVFPFALVALVAALRRPTLVTSAAIWGSVALAVACHPLALTSALATCVALVLVACFARDVPAARALACAAHVVLGVALVAAIFMPLNARLLTYGVHFGIGAAKPWEQFGTLLTTPVPQATLGPFVAAGYLGIVAALVSRRGALVLLAGVAALLLFFLLDQPYLLFDAAPSPESARFQAVRLASASKAGIYVLGSYVLSLALQRARAARPARGGLVLAAALTVGLASVLRGGLPFLDRHVNVLRGLAHTDVPDEDGLRAVAAWARERNRENTPGHFGRLLHEDDRRFYSVYHVNALSGLPTLWVGPVSCLFLRERIEDASAASLRRFDVRWVMRRDEPPSLGEPATERRFGRYFVRELRDWDGAFARVERGTGSVVVTRLDDERVDVELSGTTEPALVALGMGYYPRWRATHAESGALPVYAWPSIDGGTLSIPAAWLPPGHTTFRADGPLASDGNGRALTLVAALAALGGVLAWRHRRARTTLLRALARASREVARRKQPLLLALSLASGAGIFALGLATAGATSPALELGVALRGTASVESRGKNGAWHSCIYSVWYGAYRCRGALLVQDGMSDLLDDAPPSPPFSVPSIVISASERAAEVRLRVPARLAGDYWARTEGGEARLTTADGRRVTLDGRQRTLSFEPRAELGTVTLEAAVAENASLKIALVRRDRLEPNRGYPRAPDTPPRLR